jgi:hypothetical protein
MLGIPTFEDKVAQRAVTMVLEEIYEPKSGSWVIATMARIGAFDGDEHNCFDAFASPGG